MKDNAYQDMARSFMELWQKQVASAMSDKQFIHAMLELFQPMAGFGAKTNDANTASSHASPAPDDRDRQLAELSARLAACEQRIAKLEGRGTPPGKPDAGTAKRGRKPRA